MTKHTIKNPNIDRITPSVPEEEETRQPARRGGESHERELEDEVGGDRELENEVGGDREPMMVPPGTVIEREPLDPEALAADRATARTSDRTDARDGVDASDEITRDPDAIGGKPPRR